MEREDCSGCRAPLAGDQRYCLHCGQRRGEPRVDFLALIGADRAPELPPVPAGAAGPPPRRRLLPSRRVSGGLASVTLVLGAILGAAVHGPASTLAAPRGAVIAVADATAPVAKAVATIPAASSDDDAGDDTSSSSSGDDAAAAAPADSGVAADPGVTDVPAGDDDTTPVPDDGGGAPTATPAPATTTPAPAALPPVQTVWVVTLPPAVAAQAVAPFAGKGTVLSAYTPLAGGALANGMALLGGHEPTPDTAADCPLYGDACVLPASEATLAGQLGDAGRRWRAYLEHATRACEQPVAGTPAGPLARDPFVFFHSVLDVPVGAPNACIDAVGGLERLAPDLADRATTPALSWIVPDADPATGGDPVVLFAQLVAQITATAAYKDGGLIVAVPETVPAPAPAPAPGTPAAAPAPPPPALLLSPFVATGRTDPIPIGPYGLLRSLEDLLTLAHLGHAGDPAVAPLAPATYVSPTKTSTRRSQK